MSTRPLNPQYAVVTLLTSDSYLPGALTTVNSLLDVEPDRSRFDTVCLTTPSTVGHNSLQALQKVFDAVVGVEPLVTESWEELKLLGRRDLALTLTKLHLFRLTQYTKVLFLDADTLVLRPLSHLFSLPHSFAAAPDQGWPDAFNSGVFLAEPSQQTFDGLTSMMRQRGTWDGGDQGLLNDFFPNWHRLSFTYNVTPSAYYTYAPAYKRHGQDASVLHFIGADKPWKRGSRSTYDPESASKDYYGLVNQWYDVFERHFGSISTWDVASRVRQPPAFFKSTFTTLPAIGEGEKTSLQQRQKEESPQPATPTSPIPTISLHPPPSSLPPPVPIVSSTRAPSPPSLTWDPSRSSPPRDGPFQMRDPLPTGEYAQNVWDAPSSQQKHRFEPPKRYPSPPRETHDWYKDVMRSKPDPSAVKPVFPWEQPMEPPTPSGKTPARPAAIPPPTRTFSEEQRESIPPPAFRGGSGFTNAWDAVPGIKRYADSLVQGGGNGGGHSRSKSSSSASASGSGSGGQGGTRASSRGHQRRRSGSGTSGGGMGPRRASSETVRAYDSAVGGAGGVGGGAGAGEKQKKEKAEEDASSRDGDDEDDEEDFSTSTTTDDEEGGNNFGGQEEDDEDSERDRIQIRFRQRPGSVKSASTTSSSPSPEEQPGTPRASASAGSALAPTSPGKPRYVPTSPRQTRPVTMSGSPHSSSLTGASPYLSVPSSSSAGGVKTPSLHLSIPASGSPKSPSASGAISPSKAALTPRAQAVRNMTHARLVASGAGLGDHAPPVVRATRVFRPETDTGVVKQQGLAALQRFVENMEAAQNSGGGGGEGGQPFQQPPQY
ncbi:hypothetical protein JCM11251_004775 [Rhodosporidiobolus azoricus]